MARRPHVALIVETSSLYGQKILRGINRYLRSHQPWSIFLEQRALTTRPPGWLKGWKGDGIISRATNHTLARTFAESGVPVVDLTDRRGDFGFPRIRADDQTIGRMAADHLLQRGFRNLAFCGFAREAWSQRRRDAFAETARRAEAACHVYESAWFGADRHPWEDEQQQLIDWLRSISIPAGVMACNDMRGQHVLDACGRADLAVPEEVAVIGVDDEEILCELCNPPLSSVISNPERVGYRAAEILDRLMAGGSASDQEVLIEPLGIAIRQSTDVSAIEDPDVAMAVKYIREQSCKGATVDDILSHLTLSRSILERRFRKYLGHSPQEMILQTRIKRVKQLLLETELPLERISTLAGFKHTEHMCVVFKRESGLTPGTFRKEAKR